ncbi:MAG: outer membrane protein assembly factor BamD [Gallionellaceae bacterium]|nr:outer membrane protein assembly factor BamD [Gallionellaceae bacterium]
MRHSLALIFVLLMLIACSTDKNLEDARSATEMYTQGMEHMKNGEYEKAIKSFEALQSHFPYGRYAQQAQLETAYAYFKQDETDSAYSTIDRFIKQYPNNVHVDYAYYLKGLINFNEELGLLGDITQPDMAELDARSARESFDAFKELLARFPDSKYAPDSRLRMQYLVNALARHETQIAAYYLRRGAYVAAASRANRVLSEFPQTWSARDALQIMVQAYDAMGMKDLGNDAQRVLNLNIAKDGLTPATRPSPQNKVRWWQFWK